MTALVYFAIIALWAVFLIPWLGRHRDEQSGRRSGERYNRAMSTLARNNKRPQPVDDLSAGLDADLDSEIESDLNEDLGWNEGFAFPGRFAARFFAFRARAQATTRPRRSRAARRRRTVLVVLAAGLTATAAAVATGRLPAPYLGVFGGLLLTYLAALWVQLRRRTHRTARVVAQTVDTDRHREAAVRAQTQARNVMGVSPKATQARDAGWDARPTTLPTYVNKPKASKVPRVVDLTAPEPIWTGQAMVQRAQEEQQRARSARVQFAREMSIVEPDPLAEIAQLANPRDSQPRTTSRQHNRRAANG